MLFIVVWFSFRTQVEELNDLVAELEKEKKKLLKKISDRDQQLKMSKDQIGQYKKQMDRLQTRLDKVRFITEKQDISVSLFFFSNK